MHTGLSYEPLDHRVNLLRTASRRSNSETVNRSSPTNQPDCAGCHANDFRPGSHKKHENPDAFYTASELRDCSGVCDMYTDSSMTTISRSRPGPEHRISGSGF